MKRINDTIISDILLVAIGLVLGYVLSQVNLITLKKEVGVGEATNFILTLFVAVYVPIGLNQWLDSKRYLKGFLIDEVKSCLLKLEVIKNKIDICEIENKSDMKDKREILSKFGFLDISINSLNKQLGRSFGGKSGEIIKSLDKARLQYWKDVTDGELMNEKFVINKTFCKTHNRAYFKLEGYLKKIVYLINQF